MMQRRPATIAVIEDDDGVRDALRGLLAAHDFRCLTFASAEAYCRAPPAPPDCLLIDLKLPGANGLALQGQLASPGPAPAIIFISGDANLADAMAAVAGGAVDFLQKPLQADLLLERIEGALAYQRNIPPNTASTRPEATESQPRLEPSERELIARCLQGYRADDIARQTDLDTETIETASERIRDKVGAQTLGDVAHLLLADGGAHWRLL